MRRDIGHHYLPTSQQDAGENTTPAQVHGAHNDAASALRQSASSSTTAAAPQHQHQSGQADVSLEEGEEEEGEEHALVGDTSRRSSSESTIAPTSVKAGGQSSEPLDSSTASLDDSIIFRDRPQATPPATISSRRRRRDKRKSNLMTVWQIAKEALPTLVLSLLSLMFSGELLVHLARWPVFLKVDKLFILLPILLNLKGNLEMNLSLRMSTSANIGELDIKRTRETLIVGNMTLLQVQALIVSAGAGILAFILGVVAESPKGNVSAPPASSVVDVPNNSTSVIDEVSSRAASFFVHSVSNGLFRRHGTTDQPKERSCSAAGSSSSWFQPRRVIHHHPKPPSDPALRLRNGYFEFVLVLATGMLSASISSAILGNFMCALVVVARQVGANPDNIASPLAASLGDLLTLIIVGLLASFLVRFEGTGLATVILVLLIIACIICFVVTRRNAYVRELLSSGWVPLLIAMFISSGAGLVLDTFVQRYEGFALLAPVVTGLPGACAAIFVSRISTTLHSGKGEMTLLESPVASPRMSDATSSSSSPWTTRLLQHILPLFNVTRRPTEGWLVPLTLLIIGFTIETFFLFFVWASGQMHFGWQFVLVFSILAIVAVAFALFVAHSITLWLWERDYDPDIYCLPYVSSIIDVVGQILLVAAFATAIFLGDHITAAVGAGEGHGGV